MEYWAITTGKEGEPGIDGGKVTRSRMAVPGVGWMASCVDTEGNPFGLMQDDPNAR